MLIFYKQTENWDSEPSMNVARGYAASAMFENDDSIWWITGGYDGTEIQDTEIFNVNNNSFSNTIDLPKAMWVHNLVNVNNTHMVVLGGRDNTDEVYYINRFYYI